MKKIAIIPARSGSKGLKNKNIKLLNGKPLIAYSIEAAFNSGLFDEVVVSTDSEEYGNIAKSFGASVPYLRGEELSGDKASSWDVVKDILKYYQNKGENFEVVALLQPTSPLRTADDIKLGFEVFEKNNANFVVGVCEMDHSPLWANTLPDDNSMEKFIKVEAKNAQRQSLETYYRINGALYIIKSEYLLKTDDIYAEKSFAYIMDKARSVDIDDAFDFKMAEYIMTENIKI